MRMGCHVEQQTAVVVNGQLITTAGIATCLNIEAGNSTGSSTLTESG